MSCYFDIHNFDMPLPQHTCFENRNVCWNKNRIEEGLKLNILGTGNLSGLKGFDSYLLIKDLQTAIFIPISQEM